ncbi:hypothetical protein AB0B31_33065 [Catellatospora citrea]|uniref:Hsp70 family protein n=1 Tax=Catellatospora citrea TaxID=53366 RepID=UPI0033DBC593
MADRDIRRIIGFDFGHGETSVSRLTATASQPTVLEITPGRRVITTAVGIAPGGISVIGDEALRRSDVTDLSVAFKKANLKDRAVSRPTGMFIDAVIRQLENNGEPVDEHTLVVFGHPSGWSEDDVAAYEKVLSEIVRPAATLVMPESRAAFLTIVEEAGSDLNQATLGERVVIIDIGSSTTDFTLAIESETSNALDDDGNAALGGALIEEFLLERAIDSQRMLKRRRIRRVLDRYPSERARALIEFRHRKEVFFTGERFEPGETAGLLAAVALMADGPINLTYRITALDLDDSLNSPLPALGGVSWLSRYESDLKDVAARVERPSKVILAGGASRMEPTLSVAKAVFPTAEVVRASQPEHAVSLGLARAGAIHRRALGFRTSVAAMIDDNVIGSVVNDAVPELIGIYTQWYTHEAYELALRMIGQWRSGNIDTLAEVSRKLSDELPVHLAGEQAQTRFYEYLQPWHTRLSTTVDGLIQEVSDQYDIPYKLVKNLIVEAKFEHTMFPDARGAQVLGQGGTVLAFGALGVTVLTGLAIGSMILPGAGTVIGGAVGFVLGIFAGAETEEAFLNRNIQVPSRAKFTDEIVRQRMRESRVAFAKQVRASTDEFLSEGTTAGVANRRKLVSGMVRQIEESLTNAAMAVETLIR